MTAILTVQLMLIRKLRIYVRKWYESEVLMQESFPSFMKTIRKVRDVRKRRKRKRKKQKKTPKPKARKKRVGKKRKRRRSEDRKLSRSSEEGSKEVPAASSPDTTTDFYNFFDLRRKFSKDRSVPSTSSPDTTTDFYNFFDLRRKLSKDRLSNAASKAKTIAMGTKSTDSSEEIVRLQRSKEAVKSADSREDK
ncbi:hypothetical protein TELCIR_01767 [Teladorsagia circumcincta]|uniref:Uncharacterized protein n=1 Tax=Teladorsagia circumcincta TaxID=45464 RepID=A0A2G9V125_TELCI|nr:hypothetical protein TELCIR_01767 [Teladorsagia circumcincta]